MKILNLRFKNLNSLEGEWAVDLTHPAFVSDGLFAITGPTGAGKTTILDAVCLALYGRTPRLNKVTKSGNEIMSRRTGECFAEVTFETRTGRFRCHWSQHRARKSPDGDFQSPKHEIADADSGEIFESKIKGVADQIETVTGMDFDRFTRSMLLAQGGFAAFLQAPPDERAPILEQITGTEIYSRISIRVHERQRQERDKLELLRAETAGILLLTPEQEQGLHRELEARQKEETEMARQLTETGAAIAWLTAIEGLRKDISRLTEEENRLQRDIEAFKPERDKLSRALRAASLDGSYATLVAIRKQQAEAQAALKIGEAALPELESAAQRQAQSLKSAEERSTTAKGDLKAAAPLIRQICSLDQRLGHQKQELLAGEKDCRKVLEKMAVDRQARLKEEERRAEAFKNLERAEAYLRDHARDEWLIGGLAGVEEQLGSLLFRQKEIAQKETDLKKAVTTLEQATKKLDTVTKQSSLRKQKVAEISEKIHRAKESLTRLLGGRLPREYRAEQEALLRELAFLTRIAELEDYRAKLEDGKPCPLCGATEHPFALGQVPVADETEKKIEALTRLIRKAEDQEGAIKKLEEAKTAADQVLNESEKQETAAANDQKAAAKTLAEVTETLETLRTDFNEHRQAVAAKLLPLGITAIPETQVPSLLKSLHERLKAWQDQVRKKAEIEKQLASCDNAMKTLDAVLEMQGQALAEKQERVSALQKEYADGCEERKQLYGARNPDEEESRLNKALSTAEEAEKKARELYDDLRQKQNTAKTHISSLKEGIGRRDSDLKKLETEWGAALKQAVFFDEKQFLEARMAPQPRDELATKAKELDDSQTRLQGIKKDQEARLAKEIDKKVTDQSMEELEPHFKEYEDSLKDLREILAGFRHRLRENTAAKEQIKEKQTAIEAQKKECRRWDDLHELIGSADGKKYRNFAQGLTFEMMVGHANRQLRKMTDRYLLVRDETQPLELNVVDNYQAGEVRSTKNLSGGESFIVSLALALGLSHMASKNVRVDSLFLDEGFGTLDEEALETALETLASLHQDGKLIGVISHVAALKERISAQIQVIPQTGGRSQITGPGCKKL